VLTPAGSPSIAIIMLEKFHHVILRKHLLKIMIMFSLLSISIDNIKSNGFMICLSSWTYCTYLLEISKRKEFHFFSGTLFFLFLAVVICTIETIDAFIMLMFCLLIISIDNTKSNGLLNCLFFRNSLLLPIGNFHRK